MIDQLLYMCIECRHQRSIKPRLVIGCENYKLEREVSDMEICELR